MKHRIAATSALAFLLCTSAAFAQKTTAEGLFREALMKERAEGNLPEAIFRYERLIVEFPKDRQFAAQALFQLAQVYEKMGDPRAKLMLTRLSRDYANVEPYATRARTRLAALQAPLQSGPFPERALDKEYWLGSPDGRWVIFRDEKELRKLYLKELSTGRERLLVDQPGMVSNFAWSPDSTRIAYHYQETQSLRGIRIVAIATGETTNPGIVMNGYPMAWTGTDEIFFYRPNYAKGGVEHWLAPAKGGSPREVYFDAGSTGSPQITPDGQKVVVARSKKLFLVNIADGQAQAVITSTGEETRPMVSHDGRLVAYAANLEGNWAFYVAPLDKGLPVKQPLKITDIHDPAWGGPASHWWTNDGLLTLRMYNREGNVYRVEMDSRSGRAVDSPQRLTQDARDNWNPAVSPDGKHIAYWYSSGSKVGIAVMDSDGANERPLYEQWAILPLHWRSAEELLFYNFKPKEGEKTVISALNINTGTAEAVGRVEGLYWTYVPNRKEILHLYPGGGGPRPQAALKSLSLNDGKERVVVTIDNLWSVLVSPDEKRIAYTTIGGGSANTPCELSLMSIIGEDRTVLIPSQQECMRPFSWSPDGKYLLYSMGNTGPRILNVETRESWPLHADMSDTSWGAGSWSPDGRFIAISKRTNVKERLAWEGVTAEAVARLMERK